LPRKSTNHASGSAHGLHIRFISVDFAKPSALTSSTAGELMSNSPVHCPLCNATRPAGLGLVVYDGSALVEYRCKQCGELFACGDRREQELVQLNTGNEEGSDEFSVVNESR